MAYSFRSKFKASSHEILFSWTFDLLFINSICRPVVCRPIRTRKCMSTNWLINYMSTRFRQIVWCIKSRTLLFINLSSIVRFLKGTLTQIWNSAKSSSSYDNNRLKVSHLLLFEICARKICEVYKHSGTIELKIKN